MRLLSLYERIVRAQSALRGGLRLSAIADCVGWLGRAFPTSSPLRRSDMGDYSFGAWSSMLICWVVSFLRPCHYDALCSRTVGVVVYCKVTWSTCDAEPRLVLPLGGGLPSSSPHPTHADRPSQPSSRPASIQNRATCSRKALPRVAPTHPVTVSPAASRQARARSGRGTHTMRREERGPRSEAEERDGGRGTGHSGLGEREGGEERGGSGGEARQGKDGRGGLDTCLRSAAGAAGRRGRCCCCRWPMMRIQKKEKMILHTDTRSKP